MPSYASYWWCIDRFNDLHSIHFIWFILLPLVIHAVHIYHSCPLLLLCHPQSCIRFFCTTDNINIDGDSCPQHDSPNLESLPYIFTSCPSFNQHWLHYTFDLLPYLIAEGGFVIAVSVPGIVSDKSIPM